jgi:LysR family glycine cleavage system transcriptional activator
MVLPPLKSLIAFEAVVRNGSVSRAAEELGVTQPAVSQQIRVAERYFGRAIVRRSAGGVEVEGDAELYATRLRTAFEAIRDASAEFQARSQDADRRLTVSLLATLAQRWLIPRLIGFQTQHPEIDVRLLTTSQPIDLVRDDVDLSIRCGAGRWPGHDAEFLVPNRVFPVASSAYLETCPLRVVADLQAAVLIRVETPPRDQDWTNWLVAAGAPDLQPQAWQTFSTSTQALEAATAGMGVAMAHTPFVMDSVSSGRLRTPFTKEYADAEGDYFLVHRKAAQLPTRVALFRQWLRDNQQTPA